MEALLKRAPALTEHMYEDRDWLWYCGPSLQKAPKVRELLKELGFRFAPSGHKVGDMTGSWGNSCLRPTFPQRSKRAVRRDESADDGCGDYLDIMKEMLVA